MSGFREVLNRLVNGIRHFYRLYVLRDAFSWNMKRWFMDKGDETLRLDYPIDKSGIVFDVGGYIGDYANDINQRYGCRVYLFEPVPSFYQESVRRFSGNPSIVCLNFGLSSHSGWFDMSLDDNASSFRIVGHPCATQKAQVRAISEVVAELGVERIDLMKINIEGAEFDLLPAIIDSGLIKQINYIQIQFHNFVDGAVENRQLIRAALGRTHREMWNYDFVWESWELR